MNNWFVADSDLYDPPTVRDKEFEEWLVNEFPRIKEEPLTPQEQKIIDEAKALMLKKGLLN